MRKNCNFYWISLVSPVQHEHTNRTDKKERNYCLCLCYLYLSLSLLLYFIAKYHFIQIPIYYEIVSNAVKHNQHDTDGERDRKKSHSYRAVIGCRRSYLISVLSTTIIVHSYVSFDLLLRHIHTHIENAPRTSMLAYKSKKKKTKIRFY